MDEIEEEPGASPIYSIVRDNLLYAIICQEEGAFTVTVRLLNHRNQSQVAWGEEIAETVEVASSMIGALAREFSIAEKCIAIELRMASLKEGTLH